MHNDFIGTQFESALGRSRSISLDPILNTDPFYTEFYGAPVATNLRLSQLFLQASQNLRYSRNPLGDLRINKIPIFEREGWLCQPSLSKTGILFSCKPLG